MRRGEVWWASLPPPIGRRPVVIVTRSAAVVVRNQVVIAQITRTQHGIQSEVQLTRADGMSHDSVINCDSLQTIPKARLERRITVLTSQKLRELDVALRFALEL
jgi:mRNA interferase MazF